jgi:AraC family transcriptional regulator
MTSKATQKYAQKFNLISDFIYRNLDEDLSIEILSQVASFSKYHFHRQFSVHMGINVYKFIQLLRLKRASYRLVFNKDIKIIDIAFSQFRKHPEWKPWHDRYHLIKYKGNNIMQVSIVDFKETKVAVLEHRGDPKLLNDSLLYGEKRVAHRDESELRGGL